MTTDPSPKLPLWVFVVSDVALLSTAWLIAEYSPHPLSSAAVAAITGCAALGTLVLLVPLLLRYERQKNEVLDERQRSLEGIARTVQESAEQLSIAANGLNQIAGLTRQGLLAAEALPEKLKTQLAAFDTKTASAHEAERARLEKEVAALRQSNADQLAQVAGQIAQITTEWTKLEAAARLQLTSANEAIGKLDAQAATRITAAHATALAELEARLKSLPEAAAVTAPLAPTSGPSNPPAPTASAAEPAPLAPALAESAYQNGAEPAALVVPVETAVAVPPPAPKRPRKPRREASPEPAGTASALPAETPSAAAPAAITSATPDPVPTAPPPASTEGVAEPTTEAKPQAALSEPVADATTPIASAAVAPEPSASTGPESTPEVTAPKEDSSRSTEAVAPAPAPTESPRKRVSRAKVEPPPEPMLDLVIDDSAPPVRAMERGLSSDGATRMIVTAYIGIGNRLFIRGEGPGLSPDKGVPLQFVSIGKWRWETNDATAPIRFRILKNDSVECTGLGEQTLEPGYQAEFGASF